MDRPPFPSYSFQDYRFASDNVNQISLYVTDLILFSISPNADGSLGPCCLYKSHFNTAHIARRQRKRSLCEDSVSSDSCVGYGGEPLRLLVSIGGGGRSQNFASLVDNEESRSRFVEEILELCTREDLNGVDFDWEQPQDKNQMMGYMTLIVETWSAFQNSPSNLLVTVALHPNQFLPKAIFQYIDRVHLMTYDMIMPSSTKGGYLHHADFNMAKQMVEAFVERGCPRSKLVLGIPAYGRHGKDPNQVMTFSDLVSVNGIGGLHTRQESNGYLYDSPINVRAKVKWAAENQLAGVFFWEAGQDVIFESGVKERGLLQSAADEATQLASLASKGEVWQLDF